MKKYLLTGIFVIVGIVFASSHNAFAYSSNCNSQIKLVFGYEDTSPDYMDKKITKREQEVARFWLYSPCDVSIDGLHTQPFGVSSTEGVNDTFRGAKRFSRYTVYKGQNDGNITALPVLASLANTNGGMSFTFKQPLKLAAGVPQPISIGGKLKSNSGFSKTQFCISDPVNLRDAAGTIIPIYSTGGMGEAANFIGRFTCGDIVEIQ